MMRYFYVTYSARSLVGSVALSQPGFFSLAGIQESVSNELGSIVGLLPQDIVITSIFEFKDEADFVSFGPGARAAINEDAAQTTDA